MSAARLKGLIEGTPEVEIEPPRPLQRPLEPADPFPMEALGSVLGGAALAIIDQVQCPEAIAGQSVLAVATLAVQGHANIELPQGSTAPLSSFFLTVASSGERKSTADRKALPPIRERNSMSRRSRIVTSRLVSCSRSTMPPKRAGFRTPGEATLSWTWRSGCSSGSALTGRAGR